MKRLKVLLLLCLCMSGWVSAQIPAGYYYRIDGKQKAELKSALCEIISQAKMLRYGGSGAGYTWSGFYFTDRLEDGQVVDMYSNEVRYQTDSTSVSGMHIEHSLPKSWWGAINNNAYKDLHHLYPSDGRTNSTKNNLPLGESENPTFDNGVSKIGPNSYPGYVGRCFEPADEFKGDFARAYLYISTAYENFAELWNSPMMQNNSYPVWQPWAIDLLLKWHREDPVSTKELVRQEAVFTIQGNRNPFIDYPELVEYIWGTDTLNTYSIPAETRPFIVSPNQWNRVDFGIVMQHSNKTSILEVKGINLTSGLKVWSNDSTGSLSLSQSQVTASQAAIGTQLSINFNALNTGGIYDTLFVCGIDLPDTIKVPISAIVVDAFMSLPVTEKQATSAKLEWMTLNNATQYEVIVQEGTGTRAGNLFFSLYIEGSGYNKALELYNGTNRTIDLSEYSLQKQNNGVGSFMGNTPLQGSLAPGATYLMVHGSSNLATLINMADSIIGNDQYSILSFNGNDAVGLYHKGILIDVIGEIDNSADWGKDVTLSRSNIVTHPNHEFNWNEWVSYPTDDISPAKQHTLIPNSSSGNISKYRTTTAHVDLTNLDPEQEYFYYVRANINGQYDTTINSVQFKTEALEVPVTLEASEIFAHQFTANWEVVPEASHYWIDIFQIDSLGTEQWLADFDNIGSNGKPLPQGWSGTASGNYTTTTSSGTSPNSLCFKNNGETLQTPMASGYINSLRFMYRFPTSGVTSTMLVEALKDNSWTPIDTLVALSNAKAYASYSFSNTEKIGAIRWTYTKVTGNFALDDVEIHYTVMDSSYVYENVRVNGSSYIAYGLQPFEEYIYQVRSGYNHYSSETSLPIYATTNDTETWLPDSDKLEIYAYQTINGIGIAGVCETTDVYIYSIQGQYLGYKRVSSGDNEISLPAHGVYLLQLVTKSESRTLKVIR